MYPGSRIHGFGRSKAGGGWSPTILFAAGEQGVWLDPSDFSTLFQDSAGTTSVTAVGQPVGKILDKSGRGNHAVQAVAASRPTLQQDVNGFYYLGFDGVTASLATSTVDLSATSKLTVFAGYEKTGTTAQILFETASPLGTAAGAYGHIINDASPNEYLDFTQGGGTPAIFLGKFANAARAVVSHAADQAGASNAALLSTRLNGVAQALTYFGGVTTPSNFVNQAIFIGRRNGGSLFFVGKLFQLIVRGAVSSIDQITLGERFVGAHAGIAL